MISQPTGHSPLCMWHLLIQGKVCSVSPHLGERLEAPADTRPPRRTTGYRFTNDISQSKWARFKHDMHDSVFPFFVGFCYNWWKLICGYFLFILYCTVVPAVWASPSESSGGGAWFSRHNAPSLSFTLSLLLFFSYSPKHKTPWERGLCSTLVAHCLLPNNTCNTDEYGVKEGWVGPKLCSLRPPKRIWATRATMLLGEKVVFDVYLRYV